MNRAREHIRSKQRRGEKRGCRCERPRCEARYAAKKVTAATVSNRRASVTVTIASPSATRTQLGLHCQCDSLVLGNFGKLTLLPKPTSNPAKPSLPADCTVQASTPRSGMHSLSPVSRATTGPSTSPVNMLHRQFSHEPNRAPSRMPEMPRTRPASARRVDVER